MNKHKHFEEQLKKLVSNGSFMDNKEDEQRYKDGYMQIIRVYTIDQVLQLLKLNIRNQHMKMMELQKGRQVNNKSKLVKEIRRIEVNIECCEKEIKRRCE